MYKQAPKSPILKALVGNQPNLPEGLREAIEATPNKMMDSPTKMNKGERYDMKMASDQNLRPSARKNYAENAEAAQKSSPTKQTKKVLTPKQKLALRKTMDESGSKEDFKKRIEGTKKPVTPKPTSRADNKEYLEGQKRKILTSKSKR